MDPLFSVSPLGALLGSKVEALGDVVALERHPRLGSAAVISTSLCEMRKLGLGSCEVARAGDELLVLCEHFSSRALYKYDVREVFSSEAPKPFEVVELHLSGVAALDATEKERLMCSDKACHLEKEGCSGTIYLGEVYDATLWNGGVAVFQEDGVLFVKTWCEDGELQAYSAQFFSVDIKVPIAKRALWRGDGLLVASSYPVVNLTSSEHGFFNHAKTLIVGPNLVSSTRPFATLTVVGDVLSVVTRGPRGPELGVLRAWTAWLREAEPRATGVRLEELPLAYVWDEKGGKAIVFNERRPCRPLSARPPPSPSPS